MSDRLFGPCPGCGHSGTYHVGGGCYACSEMHRPFFCGWSALGERNAYDLPPGWHNHAYAKRRPNATAHTALPGDK